MQTGVTEKSEAQRSVTADAIQTVFGQIGNFFDCVRAQVCELAGLDVAPDLLGRVEVRRVAWQCLDAQPIALAGDQVQHAAAAMRGQSVPQQEHGAVLLEFVQERQKLDKCCSVVGARTQLENQMCV